MIRTPLRAVLASCLSLFCCAATAAGAERPVVFWSAEPVQPGETAMLQGTGWNVQDSQGVQVTLRSVGENDNQPLEVPLLEGSETSLRFVVPKSWKPGVYRCRIETPGGPVDHVINRPQPWWFQADRGQSGTPGGWLAIYGRCLELISGKARVELRRADRTISLSVEEATLWNLRAKLPEELQAGSWQVYVINGAGGAEACAPAGTLEIVPADPFWGDRVFDVAEFGAVANDGADDSEALEKALAAVADSGGGIVRFGRGRFRFDRGFELPPRLLVEGAGPAATHLVWADMETPPPALLSSTEGRLGIRDLSLYAHNYECGLAVDAGKPERGKPAPPRAADVLIERVNARFTPLARRLSPEQRSARQAMQTIVMRLRADRVSLVDCDLAWYSKIGFAIGGNDKVCRNNRCFAQVGGWCPVGGGRRAIVEHNQFTGITTGVTRGAQVWFAHNRVEHHYAGFREGFTTDGTFGGPGFLTNTKIDGRHVRFEAKRSRTDGPGIPAALRILEGKGAGLVAEIESFDPDRRGFTLRRDWPVQPDETSILWAANEMGQHLFYDNEVADTGIAIQLYGSASDCVVAGNRSRRSGGFRVKGNWTCNYVQFLGNHIAEGNGTIGPEANAGRSSVNVEGPYVDGFKGVTARGFVIRDNLLENDAEIFLRGSVHDVLVEHNRIVNSRRGVFADQWPRQRGVLLRENRFESVEVPLYPPQPESYRVIEPSD